MESREKKEELGGFHPSTPASDWRAGMDRSQRNRTRRKERRRSAKKKKKDRKTLETLERETMRKEGGAGAEEEGVPVGRKQELGIRLSLSDAKFPFKLPRQVVPDR